MFCRHMTTCSLRLGPALSPFRGPILVYSLANSSPSIGCNMILPPNLASGIKHLAGKFKHFTRVENMKGGIFFRKSNLRNYFCRRRILLSCFVKEFPFYCCDISRAIMCETICLVRAEMLGVIRVRLSKC